jgi:hypothetical protein
VTGSEPLNLVGRARLGRTRLMTVPGWLAVPRLAGDVREARLACGRAADSLDELTARATGELPAASPVQGLLGVHAWGAGRMGVRTGQR